MPGTAALTDRIAEAELRLRAALLAGSVTDDLHAELAALRTDRERLLAEQADATAQARSEEQRTHRACVAEAAAGHAAAAAERLAGRMATLAPPPSPIRPVTCSAAPTRTLAP